MAFQIQNGQDGPCSFAKVDEDGNLHTFSITEPTQGEAAREGNSYNVNTGTVNLTSANESAVAYIKNNGDSELHIENLGYLLGNAKDGAGDLLPADDLFVTVIRNPTGGTIVTNAVDMDVAGSNKNYGSSKTLDADIYKGAEGDTVTGGNNSYFSLIPKSGSAYPINTGKIVLTKGDSIAIKIQPQTGNASMNVQVFFAVTDYRFK